MVLMNTLIVGLALFILVWIPSGTSELQKRQSQSPETTTTLVKTITELQNATGTTKELPTIASKPKTDDTNDNNNVEQKRTRGSTKYVDYAYSTTEPTKETSTITKQNLQQTKSARLTTVRNDRSLSLNTDKYNSPEFHSENKIYSETQTADNRYGIINRDKSATEKTWEHMNFAEPDLTTPRNEVFDNKFRKLQEEITRSLNDVLTTERIPDEKYKETRESLPILMDLTTPKDELFDSRHKEMQEDLSKSLKNVDRFFNEKKVKETPDNIEQPQLNDSKLDYTRYRRIEMNESKIMNMVRKDYNAESGTKMKHSSNYNNTQIIDAPGIVANTIPTQKDKGSIKKIDLDQGESVHEKITIEKPEKDPSMLINNKIENELINPLTTEGPEEKPFEHKSIYLSKRGSTIHSKEESVERSASTESGIPLDLYASKSPTPDLSRTSFSFNNADSDTFISKSVKKDKVLKKELEISQSDFDNKIPKFLPMTTQNIQIEISTEKPFKLEKLTEKNTGETLYEVNTSSTTADISTATEINVGVTTESFSTSETISVSDSSEATTASDFFEATDSTTLKTTINEDLTVSIESTVDNVNISESTTAEEKEEIATERTTSAVNTGYTSRDTETIDVTTLEITTESQNWKTDLMEDILSSNNSRNEIITTSEHLNVNNTATENTETVETKETTEKSVFSRVTFAESNYTDLIKDTTTTKKNENVSNVINEITKSPNLTATVTNNEIPSTKSVSTQWEAATENIIHNEEVHIKENGTKQQAENDQTKQNEINGDKLVSDECENTEESDDYGETNCKTSNVEESSDPEADLEDNSGHNQHPHGTENKQSTPAPLPSTLPHQTTTQEPRTTTTSRTTLASTTTIPATVTPITPDVRQTDITEPDVDTTARTDSIVSSEEDDDEDGGNGGKIAAIVISTIGGVCLLLLVALLIIMKKRQKRFNYGQRCRPVSLDAYSMDNVSIHNSTRRKGVLMTSKRSYGNPAFEDPTCPTHMLNISELLRFSNNQDGIRVEFEKIPQVTTKTNELPEGCDVKNRYANVIPLPETRVFLTPVEGIPSSDYINANYVTGPQGARHYYIACQAPMQNTIEDYWRMIWEQQSKVVLMMTHLYENGVEKCIDYLPPSEVLDCHRLFGDFQITLKKREVKDKYIISSLQLKNMISNSWREVTHLWYMGWPEKGVPEEANSLIAFLIEARSCMKTGDNKVKETNNMNISNGLNLNSNPVVVHCSPGTGRTGTVIACDIAIREFELTRKVDIPKIVYRIRRDRASAVQTKEQYSFIYKVIHFYATKLTGGAFETF